MTPIYVIVLTILGLFSLSMVGIGLLRHYIYTKPIMKSMEFLSKRNQKIANGWIPPRYAQLKTNDERDTALKQLMDR